LVVAFNEAVKVDAFAAAGAENALAFVSGELAGGERHTDPGFGEEIGVREVAVGVHLLGIFFEVGIELVGEVFGGFEGDDADGFEVMIAEGLVQVDEGRGHFAEVAEFEGALADAGTGDDADGVSGAAVDLDEDDEALAVGVEGAVREGAGAGVVDAQLLEGKHGHADAEDLAGAEVAVGEFGVVEEIVEGGGHGLMLLRRGEAICGHRSYRRTVVSGTIDRVDDDGYIDQRTCEHNGRAPGLDVACMQAIGGERDFNHADCDDEGNGKDSLECSRVAGWLLFEGGHRSPFNHLGDSTVRFRDSFRAGGGLLNLPC
jgi:hypothetical protein